MTRPLFPSVTPFCDSPAIRTQNNCVLVLRYIIHGRQFYRKFYRTYFIRSSLDFSGFRAPTSFGLHHRRHQETYQFTNNKWEKWWYLVQARIHRRVWYLRPSPPEVAPFYYSWEPQCWFRCVIDLSRLCDLNSQILFNVNTIPWWSMLRFSYLLKLITQQLRGVFQIKRMGSCAARVPSHIASIGRQVDRRVVTRDNSIGRQSVTKIAMIHL